MLDYEMFFTYSTDLLFIAGLDGSIQRANPALCSFVNRSEAELFSRPFVEWVHPEDAIRVEGAIKNLSQGHPAFLIELRLLAADGSYRPRLWSAYRDERSDLIFGIAREYGAFSTEMEQIRSLMDSAPTAVFLVEQTGTISYSNGLGEAIFGYGKDELIGQSIETLVPAQYRNIHQEQRNQYWRQPVLRPIGTVQSLVGLRKNGREFPIDVGLNPIWLDGGIKTMCSVIDLSSSTTTLNILMEERRRLAAENTRLGRLADHDGLTGLYNRRAFERLLLSDLSAAREREGFVSIIFLDIDHFKELNDAFGHLKGDILLRHIGEVLSRNVRKADTVARFGGEEFVIILPGLEHDQAAAFGERLRGVIEQDSGSVTPVTISLGATTHRFNSKRTGLKRTMKQMILEADQAMYHSKNMGRNRFSHFADLPREEEHVS